MSVLLPQTGGSPAILRLICRFPALAPIIGAAALVGYLTENWWIAALVSVAGLSLVVVGLYIRRRLV